MTKLERQRLRDIQSLAREYRYDAWEVILKIMMNDGEQTKYRLRCAEIIIERAEGKAKQRVEVSAGPGVTPADLMAMAEELKLAEQDPFIKGVLDARIIRSDAVPALQAKPGVRSELPALPEENKSPRDDTGVDS